MKVRKRDNCYYISGEYDDRYESFQPRFMLKKENGAPSG